MAQSLFDQLYPDSTEWAFQSIAGVRSRTLAMICQQTGAEWTVTDLNEIGDEDLSTIASVAPAGTDLGAVAYRTLCYRYLPLVVRYIRARTSPRTDAYDPLTLAFFFFWETLPGALGNYTPHDEARFSTWLIGVLKRQLLRSEAADFRFNLRHVPLGTSPHLLADDPRTRAELQSIVHTLLSMLDDSYKNVVIKHWLEGKSLKEVAHEMGLTYGTVRNYSYRAIQLLNAITKRWPEDF